VLKEIRTRGDIICSSTRSTPWSGAGAAEGAIDAASILKPMLARGELQTIGATTLDEYRKHIEKDAALERRFQPIQVAEPTLAHTIEILKGLRDRYEAHHRVTITDARWSPRPPGRPLHQRPVPARQGDRPDRRGRRAAAHPRMTAPPDLREFDEKIAEVRREKESAIDGQDFEKAAACATTRRSCSPRRPERREVEVRRHGRRRRGRRGADRRGALHWTGIPVFKLTEEESSRCCAWRTSCTSASSAGGRHQGAVPGDPPHPRRPEGPQAPLAARSSSPARPASARPS
jgi:ATP-dependent Clp protease ATP-binding subunit ClpC